MWMKRKTARFISIIIAIVMILSVILFAVTSFGQEDTLTLTLDSAKEIAKSKNYNLKLAKLDNSDMRLRINVLENLEEKLKLAYKAGMDQGDFDSYKLRSGYTVDEAKAGKKILDMKEKFTIKVTDVIVERQYNMLLEKKKMYDLKLKTLDLIKEKIDIASKKLEVGEISEVEFKKVNLSELTAERELEDAKNEYEKVMRELNCILSLPIDTQLELTTQLEHQKFDLPKFDEKLKQRKENDLSYQQYIVNKPVYEKEMALVKLFYGGTSTAEYKIARNKIRKNDINILKREQEINKSLKNEYDTIISMGKQLEILDKSITLSKLVNSITEISSNIGMATDVEVIESRINLEDLEIKRIQAINGYNTIVTMFKNDIDASLLK